MTPTDTLEDALVRARDLESMDLRARLQWLEDTALAAEQLDLGDDGARGVLDLKAALGALLKLSQGPVDERAIAEAALLVRMLTQRATSTLLRAVAAQHRAMSTTRGAPRRAESHLLAQAFDEMAKAVAKGEPIPQSTIDKIAEVRRAAFGS
jgi:hypothetical protein